MPSFLSPKASARDIIQSSFYLSSRILFICLVEVPCLRASGEDLPFDLGYCNSAPTIRFLSVYLVPLILLICRTILLELPTSKLYEPPNPFNSPNNSLKLLPSKLTSILQTRFFLLLLRNGSAPTTPRARCSARIAVYNYYITSSIAFGPLDCSHVCAA